MTTRRRFTQEFKLEAAQLVVDQGYTISAASSTMGSKKQAGVLAAQNLSQILRQTTHFASSSSLLCF